MRTTLQRHHVELMKSLDAWRNFYNTLFETLDDINQLRQFCNEYDKST